MDGMLSDIMEEFNKRGIIFDSDRQGERFASIMMEVNNNTINTRMLDFRGYTPNEISHAVVKNIKSAVEEINNCCEQLYK